ncbi:MAG TPA: GNAT family protein [Candidatus Limnocylindria bacterium]|nr:GNAT family protein [Candidatus Limnocylindria bacterium]
MALGGIIKGKRTTLRPPTEADLSALNGWMADIRVRHLTRVWHQPAMPATWKERLTEQTKEKNGALWAIETDGAIVGMARVGFGWEPHRASAHLHDFLIGPEHWRKGYGADAALALHRYLFDYLDLRRVSVSLTIENTGARRIADQLGYVVFAHKHEVHYRDGAYVDELELLMERATWDERWAAEREYAPLGSA